MLFLQTTFQLYFGNDLWFLFFFCLSNPPPPILSWAMISRYLSSAQVKCFRNFLVLFLHSLTAVLVNGLIKCALVSFHEERRKYDSPADFGQLLKLIEKTNPNYYLTVFQFKTCCFPSHWESSYFNQTWIKNNFGKKNKKSPTPKKLKAVSSNQKIPKSLFPRFDIRNGTKRVLW